MEPHRIVSRAEWIEERVKLLAREKAFTEQRDQLNGLRRELPWVRVEKQYVFDAPEGKVSLADLFDGRSQLFIKHFMMGPGQVTQCVGCSFEVDHVAGLLAHLQNHDLSYVVVARAPIDEIEAVRARMGWRFRWVSSYGSDFNYDFGVSIDAAVRPPAYNYRTRAEYEALGQPFGDEPFERPGHSCFLRVDDRVFHTYSHYARGTESVGGSYYFLDLTALGRQEDWEEPKDRVDLAS